jgi:hypothetical protein
MALLETIEGANGETYQIRKADSGAVYCTCPGWKFSKVRPRACKHLDDWHAKQTIAQSGQLADPITVGTIIRTSNGYEWVALRRGTGKNVWHWQGQYDDGRIITTLEEPFRPLTESIVGHVADRIADAMCALHATHVFQKAHGLAARLRRDEFEAGAVWVRAQQHFADAVVGDAATFVMHNSDGSLYDTHGAELAGARSPWFREPNERTYAGNINDVFAALTRLCAARPQIVIAASRPAAASRSDVFASLDEWL